ncbi:MAG: redoxin domain-containing protein [Planctomycetales bacterium]|nr:redoxin domain-containing protein [Planctomycetales bacterium]
MRFVRLACCLVGVLSLTTLLPTPAMAKTRSSDEPSDSPIGRAIESFELPDVYGKQHALAEWADRSVIVVAFLGTECPLAKLYGPRLQQLATEYDSRGVQLIGVNSNSQDSLTELAAYGKRHEISFPLLKDLGNRVADQFGAKRTPEVFVLDQERQVRYWGRIDDQYGVGYVREAPTQHDLRRSLDELLAGKSVSTPVTEAVGCHIGRVREPNPASPVTYSNQVARIFQRHCVECHRPGEIAPFTLTDYNDVVGWAETIEEVTSDHRMPPWHADPRHGHFANQRLMTYDEKQTVYDWVAAGAPEGNPAELPEPIDYVSGWRLSRPPDQVVAMRPRPFTVPSEGTVEYQYFVVDPGFTEDKWVHAAEVIPGNTSVVHHAIVFFRAPEGVRQRGLGWLTAYVPGQNHFELPRTQARFIPAGSKFIFQMHYTPTGSPQDDLTKVGLIFSDANEVEEELLTLVAINHDFQIPPHASNYRIDATRAEFPAGTKLLAMAPHMHVRGKAFQVDLVRPGKTAAESSRETLLKVPHYDFNWQHAYQLAEPVPLSDGARLECSGWFDNSEDNLVNPDPSAKVRWGDQTWEEMMIAFFEVSVPVGDKHARDSRRVPLLTPQQREAANRAADDLIRRFDKDGDQRVHRDDVPDAFAAFAFNGFDTNRDRYITRDEAFQQAVRQQRRKANGGGQ